MATPPEFPVSPNPNPASSDPGLVNILGKMQGIAQVTADAMSKIEEHLAKVREHSEDFNSELTLTLKLSDSIEEATKALAQHAKAFEKSLSKTKTFEQARKNLLEMKAGLSEMEKKWANNKRMVGLVHNQYREVDHLLKSMAGKQGEIGDGLLDQLSVLHKIRRSWEDIGKASKSMDIGHMTRQVAGLSRAFATAGLTKGKIASRMDKHAEVATKLRELQKERIETNKADFMARRSEALKKVREVYGEPSSSPAAMEALRKTMGVSRFKRKAFIAGEMGGGTAEAFGDLAAHGGGMAGSAMSKIAGGAEGGLSMVAGLASKAAVPLAVLELLRQGFDKTVEQNKDMESALGKGGLFTSGVHGMTGKQGAGFQQARDALTPGGFGLTKLGLSFERNLKMAQSIVEGGYNISELVTGKGSGGQEGFMPGAMGKFQEMAVGAGRIAGLGDSESIQQTVKLLQQYRMTLEGSQKFFLQINKDTKAAGISTTKYLAILDDVNNHFERMNKSMLTAMNVLREMSRTGAVAGESLQDMMSFFTQGPKTAFGTVAPAIFAAQQDPATVREVNAAQLSLLQDMIDNSSDSLIKMGIRLPNAQALSKMGINGASATFASAQSQIQRSGADAITKQSNLDAVKAIADQMRRTLGQRGGAMGYATGESMFGSNMLNNMGDMFMKMNDIAGRSGGMSNLMGGKIGPNQKLAMEAMFEQVYGIKDFQQGIGRFRQDMLQFSQGRTQNAVDDESGGRAKSLVHELMTLPGFRQAFKNNKWWIDISKNDKHQTEFLKDNFDQVQEYVAIVKGTQKYALQQAARQPKMNLDNERSAAIALGKTIGMQTQTTGDIIAAAFSTWFNDIITMLGKIVKFLIHPFANDADMKANQDFITKNKKYADEAAGILAEKIGKKEEEIAGYAQQGDENHMRVAEEQLDTLKKQHSDITRFTDGAASQYATAQETQDWFHKVAGIVDDKRAQSQMGSMPQSLDDISAQLKRNAGYGADMGPAMRERSMRTLAAETYMALSKEAGVNEDAGSGTGTMTDAAFQRLQSKLSPLAQQGLITLGTGAQGQHTITYNYYSADFTQGAVQQQLAHQSEETQTKVPAPSSKGQ